jgi:hypothetical protein
VDGVVQHALTDTPLMNKCRKKKSPRIFVTSISLNLQGETVARNLEVNTRRKNESTWHIFSQPPHHSIPKSYIYDNALRAMKSYLTTYLPIHSFIFSTIPPQTTLSPSTSHTPLSPPPHSTTSHRITLLRRVSWGIRRSPRLAV